MPSSSSRCSITRAAYDLALAGGRLFRWDVAGLLGDFDRYLDRGQIDLLRDGVSYRMAGLWLDDAEFAELMRDIARVLQPRLAKPPGPGRKRRILYSVLLPGPDTAA